MTPSRSSAPTEGRWRWLRSAYGIRDGPMTPGWRGAILHTVLAIAGIGLALTRLTPHSWGVLWTEDGGVFLSDAFRHPLEANLLQGYAGYGHLMPRLIAQATAAFVPLPLIPIATTLIMAVLTSLTALGVFYLSAAHIQTLVGRLLVWAMVVAAPLAGLEIALSTANFQWLLLVAVFWAVFARRRGPLAVTISAVIIAAGIGSSILALLILPFLALRVVLFRQRPEIVLAVVATFATVYQVACAMASPRGDSHVLTTSLRSPLVLAKTFLVDVIGVAAVGPGSLRELQAHSIPLYAGAIVVLLVVVVVAIRLRRRRPIAVVALGFSVLFFLPVTVLTGSAIENVFQWLDLGVGTRYFVLPSVMVTFVVIAAIDLLLVGDRRRRLVGLVLVAVELAVVVANLRVADPRTINLPHDDWTGRLVQARQTCAGDPTGIAYLRGGPDSRFVWDSIKVPCDVVLRSR